MRAFCSRDERWKKMMRDEKTILLNCYRDVQIARSSALASARTLGAASSRSNAAAMCCMTLMSCFHYASNLRVKPLGGFRKTEHHDHVSLSVAYVRRSPPQTSDGWQLITSLKMKCCLYISSFSPSLAFSLTRIYSRCSHTDVQFADDVLH